jgi:hypothetical protein
MIEFRVGDVTTGITKDGNVIKISTYMSWMLAINDGLVSMDIPYGIRKLQCERNNFTSLEMPDSLEYLSCDKDLFDYDKCKLKAVDIYYE